MEDRKKDIFKELSEINKALNRHLGGIHKLMARKSELHEEVAKLDQELRRPNGREITASGKKEAIPRMNAHIGRRVLNHQNTRFANVNKRKPVWWLHIPVRMVGERVNLLLRRTDGGLIWLELPPRALDGPDFRYWPVKDVISLEIRTRDLRDRHSEHNFRRYIKLELPPS